MKDTPTPRTDQNEEGIRHFDLYGFESSLAPATYEWPTFARQLERELAEMEEQCESWANQSMSWKLKADVLGRKLEESEKERRVLSDATKHLNDRMAELQRERDNAESDKKQSDTDTLRALHQRNEARDERDGHAEAMNDIADVFDMPTGASSSDIVKKVREAQDQLESWQKLALSAEMLRKKADEQLDRLADALRACREDSCELLGERSWWKDESRCGYAERYDETAKNLVRADTALASLKGGADE